MKVGSNCSLVGNLSTSAKLGIKDVKGVKVYQAVLTVLCLNADHDVWHNFSICVLSYLSFSKMRWSYLLNISYSKESCKYEEYKTEPFSKTSFWVFGLISQFPDIFSRKSRMGAACLFFTSLKIHPYLHLSVFLKLTRELSHQIH